ncbi:MAG: hypothetical protein H0T42_04410 [Deltaproteobacteria bacterium]|nr:hypothetical protein [Deltaproteobacteria bacterium]
MVDAPIKDVGFSKPIAPLKANMETAPDTWAEIGPANLACLNTPNADVANTTAVTIDTKVEDFQSGNLVPNTTVTVFANQDAGTPFPGGPYVSTSSGATVSVEIPAGTKRFGYKMINPNALDTLLLNQTLNQAMPNMDPQVVGRIQSVSTATGATLPALIGVSRTPGTGILAGAVRDCNGDEISNFIATVSSTPNTATPLEGVDAYYFSSSVGLPVRHSQQRHSSKDGLFMAIEMNPTTVAYVQAWGYPTQADLDADQLKLIAQLQTQVIADTVITGSYDPLRSN